MTQNVLTVLHNIALSEIVSLVFILRLVLNHQISLLFMFLTGFFIISIAG